MVASTLFISWLTLLAIFSSAPSSLGCLEATGGRTLIRTGGLSGILLDGLAMGELRLRYAQDTFSSTVGSR
jgi:hypothetical protein